METGAFEGERLGDSELGDVLGDLLDDAELGDLLGLKVVGGVGEGVGELVGTTRVTEGR